IAPRVYIALEVTPAGTRSPPRPVAVISPMPSGRRASSASAPSSTGTPATSEAESFPPSRGDPSRSVTLTGSSLRKNAAASPATPPPLTTTGGPVPAVVAAKPATAASAPEPDDAGTTYRRVGQRG